MPADVTPSRILGRILICSELFLSVTTERLDLAQPRYSANHPSSIMAVLYQGLTCMPDDGTLTPVSAHTCQIGGYPVYVINAESVRDIQAGVNFARNSNIRLVIKNTGHDFSGKSSGFGSLSIRTHKFKSIDYIQNYNRNGYRGPALKVGAGVQAFELYARANQLGHTVVGGEGMVSGTFA